MLRMPPPPKPREEETYFETICRLARELDLEGLKELAAQNEFFLYTTQDGYTPLRLLAQEGNFVAVQMLIQQLGAYGSEAVRGFAEAGLIQQVNNILHRRDPREFTSDQEYLAYARTSWFIYSGWNYAVRGYACAGLHDLVEDVLQKHPAAINDAIEEYAHIKNWDRVESLVQRGGVINTEHIDVAVLADLALRLRLLSLLNGEDARRQLLNKWDPWKADDEFEYFQPLKKAARINRVMHEYHLSYQQALSLHQFQEEGQLQGVRTWLLECLKLVNDRDANDLWKEGVKERVLPLLPKDVIIKITSHLLGLTEADARQVLIGVQAQHFVGLAKANADKFAFGLFSSAQYMGKQTESIDEYKQITKRFKK